MSKDVQQNNPLENAGNMLSSFFKTGERLGNITLRTAATVEGETTTIQLKAAIKNQSEVKRLIATAEDPAAAQVLADEILAMC